MHFESITSLWFFLWHNLFIPWIKRFIYRGVCGAWMRSRNYGNQQNEEVPLEWSSVGSNETYTSSISSISLQNNTNRYRKYWDHKRVPDSIRIVDTNMSLYVLMDIRNTWWLGNWRARVLQKSLMRWRISFKHMVNHQSIFALIEAPSSPMPSFVPISWTSMISPCITWIQRIKQY